MGQTDRQTDMPEHVMMPPMRDHHNNQPNRNASVSTFSHKKLSATVACTTRPAARAIRTTYGAANCITGVYGSCKFSSTVSLRVHWMMRSENLWCQGQLKTRHEKLYRSNFCRLLLVLFSWGRAGYPVGHNTGHGAVSRCMTIFHGTSRLKCDKNDRHTG